MGRSRGGKRQGAALKKPPLTHFLCLPLVNPGSRPQLEKALEVFKQNLSTIQSGQSPPHVASANALTSGDNSLSPIHFKSIRPAGTLHLTLGVMSLEKDQLANAISLLQELDLSSLICSKDAGTTEPSASTSLRIKLQGLESMHAPEKTSILYAAPTDPTNRLYPLCLALQKAFGDKGFLVEVDRELRLHATVVNTIYEKGRKKPNQKPVTITTDEQVTSDISQGESSDRSKGHGPNANAPLKFDARSIIDRFKNYTWAESVVLDRVAICEMGAKKIIDSEDNVVDERYTEVASVPLPS